MVCAKCAAKQKPTSLATPGVKKKSEMYYGSSASSATSNTKPSKSATLGNTGVGKSKLLSKSAKNPYALYSASCDKCNIKIEQGKALCNGCAYKSNACSMCGKSLSGSSGAGKGPAIQVQKFSSK